MHRSLLKTAIALTILAASAGWARNGYKKQAQRVNCEATLSSIRQNFAAPVPVVERKVEEITSLRFGTYNIYGVFKNPYAQRAKSPEQVRDMFRIINEENPDVMFMQEVESAEALQRANEELLGNRYRVVLNPSADPIHVAVLIKKDLPFDFVITSEANRRSADAEATGEKLFTRDFPVVRVYPKGLAAVPGAAPLMVMMGHHYKSKRDRPGDPQSRKVAAAQFNATRSIVAELLERYCASLPVFLSADFNRDIRTDAEPQVLLDIMKDTLDLAKETVPAESRVTQTFHPPQGGVVNNQLDAILATQGVQNLVQKASIPRYQFPDGREKPLPQTFGERSKNPSDHFPLFIRFDFKTMLENYDKTKEECVDHQLKPAA